MNPWGKSKPVNGGLEDKDASTAPVAIQSARLSRLERLYESLSLEYEQLKVRLDELEIEKNALIRQLLHYTMNRRLVNTGMLEKTRDWSRSGEELEVYFQTEQQEVNLNCSFLHEINRNHYSCHWELVSDPLVSCVGCTKPKMLFRRERERVGTSVSHHEQGERDYHLPLE